MLNFSGGYLYVKEVLEKVESLSDFDQEDVLRMVLYNDKQRFATKVNEENNRLMIRACQGHSIEVCVIGNLIAYNLNNHNRII